MTPEMITQALGMKPARSWEAGTARSTPKGTPLDGTYTESYWAADPFDRGEYSSTDDAAEDTLLQIIEVLEPRQDFFQKLRSGGGRLLVHISSYGGRNYAMELSPESMRRYAAIGISIAHDVYPCAQNW